VIVPLAMSSAAYKLEVPLGAMTADVEVNYRLDRTLAPLEEFVNDMLITKLPPIRNRANQGGRRRAVASAVVNETGIRKRQGGDRTARGSARQRAGTRPAMDDHRPIHLGCCYVAQLLGVIHRHHPHCVVSGQDAARMRAEK
jgi:hypothetical protein